MRDIIFVKFVSVRTSLIWWQIFIIHGVFLSIFHKLFIDFDWTHRVPINGDTAMCWTEPLKYQNCSLMENNIDILHMLSNKMKVAVGSKNVIYYLPLNGKSFKMLYVLNWNAFVNMKLTFQ